MTNATATRKPNTDTVSRLMAEHIALPGCPGIIVTRSWAYRWLRDEAGCDPHARGFASLDYMAFGRPATTEPLTDLTDPSVARFLAHVAKAMAA